LFETLKSIGAIFVPINFHDKKNRMTYTTRTADENWVNLIREDLDVSDKLVVDMGCGGGIYTKALSGMGARHVTGIDFSEEMLKGASENCKGIANVTFLLGNANSSNLPKQQFDIILERALIHHLSDLDACFKEANRILKKNGTLIIQDRTPKDCLLPGDVNHIRGYFFEKYPKLIDQEISRRHDSSKVKIALEANDFKLVKEVQHWETRCTYNNLELLLDDLLLRSGRSILHELTDGELQELGLFVKNMLGEITPPIIEKDSWTIWLAIKQ
jgi:ubiquinone/menaquinone biosynthesis C-methylase UbiE